MRIRLTLAVALFLVLGAAQSEENSPSAVKQAERSNETKRTTEGDQPKTEKQSTTVNLNVSGNLQIKSDDNKPKTDEEPVKWTDKVLAWLTGLLVAVTAGLIVIGEMQRRQLKRTVDSTEQLEAPFLIPELLRVEEEVMEGKERQIVFYTLRNHGKTPAIVRKFQDTLTIRSQLPNTDDEIWRGIPLDSRDGVYIPVGPAHIPIQEGHSGVGFRAGLRPEEIGHSGRLYLVGRFRYEDVFGRLFVQGFCIQLLKRVPTDKPNVFVWQHIMTGDTVYNYRRQEKRS